MKQVNVIIKKDYSWYPSTCICENSKYLKSIADDSKIVCDKLYIMEIVSTNGANTIATNATRTVSINPDEKK